MSPLRLLLPGDPDRPAVLARLFLRDSACAPEVLTRNQNIIVTVCGGDDHALHDLTATLEGRELAAIEIDRNDSARLGVCLLALGSSDSTAEATS